MRVLRNAIVKLEALQDVLSCRKCSFRIYETKPNSVVSFVMQLEANPELFNKAKDIEVYTCSETHTITIVGKKDTSPLR